MAKNQPLPPLPSPSRIPHHPPELRFEAELAVIRFLVDAHRLGEEENVPGGGLGVADCGLDPLFLDKGEVVLELGEEVAGLGGLGVDVVR